MPTQPELDEINFNATQKIVGAAFFLPPATWRFETRPRRIGVSVIGDDGEVVANLPPSLATEETLRAIEMFYQHGLIAGQRIGQGTAQREMMKAMGIQLIDSGFVVTADPKRTVREDR